MAITVRHSPSAGSIARASSLGGSLATLERVRQRNADIRAQREAQERQIAEQQRAQEASIDAQRESQLRSIEAQEQSQMRGLQGQEILNAQNRAFQGEQAFYDRNQQVGMAQFQAGQNELNRNANLASQAIAQQGRLDAIGAQGVVQSGLLDQRAQYAEDERQAAIEQARENAKFDEDSRVELTRLQREYTNLDRAHSNGDINDEQYTMARNQIEDDMARLGQRPVQPPPTAQDRIETVQFGGQEYPVIMTEDGVPQVMRGWSPPQDNSLDLQKFEAEQANKEAQILAKKEELEAEQRFALLEKAMEKELELAGPDERAAIIARYEAKIGTTEGQQVKEPPLTEEEEFQQQLTQDTLAAFQGQSPEHNQILQEQFDVMTEDIIEAQTPEERAMAISKLSNMFFNIGLTQDHVDQVLGHMQATGRI